MSKHLLILNPGHGGKDPGAIGNGLQEKNIVLDICKRISAYIKSNYSSIAVEITRSTDVFHSINQIASNANRVAASYEAKGYKDPIFVSVHINSFSATAHGYEDLSYGRTVNPNTGKLHRIMNKNVSSALSPYMVNRGMKKRNDLGVLSGTAMPAVLTESGFISNPKEAAFMKDPKWLQLVAEAHAHAVAEYFGVKKATPPKQEVKPVTKPAPTKKPTTQENIDSVSASVREEFAKAIEVGITDGSNPSDNIRRSHAAVMALRAAEYAIKQIKK